MWSHPYDGVYMRLLVAVHRSVDRREVLVLEQLAAVTAQPLDVGIIRFTELALEGPKT